ncbi:MAG: hypothetical protein NC222_06720 [Staphylococcus sp.]|nr:hypothetical protein [Staphylococcus sp.]
MSRILHCNLYQLQDKELVKIKEFDHFSYYTRYFFDDTTVYEIYDIDFPSIDMQTSIRKGNTIDVSFQYVKMHYLEVENFVNRLEKIVPIIKKEYYKSKEDRTVIYEEYKALLQIIEDLKYCLLYSKYELEDKFTIFEFIME